MKKALMAACLLLILTAVSTGTGIAWADPIAQDLLVADNPATLDSPGPTGDVVDQLGDPDDAITGNRNNGCTDDDGLISELLGGFDQDDFDADTWMLLLQALADLGLI